MRKTLLKIWIALVATFSISVANADNLTQIQQKIKQQQSKVEEQRKKRNALQSTLKKQEIEMGRVLDNLQKTELTLSEIRQTIKNTEQDIQKLEKQEIEQKERLKEQLDSAYRSGLNPSILERLLSENAKDADRMVAYYEHINQVRVELINDLRKTQEELKNRRDELTAQQQGQQTQLSAQKKQERDLKKVQNERAGTLRSLEKNLQQDENRLNTLKENEAALRRQLQQAANEAKKREQQLTKQREKEEIAKLEERKKQQEKRKATEQEKQQVRDQVRSQARVGRGLGKGLPMPVSGKVITRFGGNWSGIVIAANAGTPVKAIAAGEVVIAAYINGYGNLVAISHGNEDLSLYGYNQSLAVKKGTKVQAGQVIARVGNTGGQDRPALYFGITRHGNPVNPLNFVK